MQLADWLAYIEDLHPRSWDLGLERVGEVARRLDVCEPGGRTFLVAGTNGKGSVCSYIAALCGRLGLKTGLTTSPHLLRFNERIVIDGDPVSDDRLCDAFSTIEKARQDISLTYFEFAALAALLIFRRAGVDVAVLEVGLGGRLDAMNVVDPDVSVITRIALDHQDYLGDTRDAIALEKAGIMRAARPCVIGETGPPQALLDRGRELDCKLLVQGVDYGYMDDGTLQVAYKGARLDFEQLPAPALPRENAAAAVQALYCADLRPDRNQIAQVLSDLTLPGRFQLIESAAGRRVILDVAHNPDGAAWLQQRIAGLEFRELRAVVGMYADKDYAGVIGLLSGLVDHWHFADMPETRAARASALAGCIAPSSGSSTRTYGKVYAAFEDAMTLSHDDDLIVVFGSFPVVADVLKHLQKHR